MKRRRMGAAPQCEEGGAQPGVSITDRCQRRGGDFASRLPLLLEVEVTMMPSGPCPDQIRSGHKGIAKTGNPAWFNQDHVTTIAARMRMAIPKSTITGETNQTLTACDLTSFLPPRRRGAQPVS